MNISAIVLDMDGLMLDTEPLYKAAWQQAARELGYNLDDRSSLRMVGRPTQDCYRELEGLFGADFPLASFRARWAALWQREAEKGVPVKAGLFEFLAFACDAGLALAVATSSDSAYTDMTLRQAGLMGRFSVVVTGDQVACGKPAPDIYLEAARQLDVPPSRCVALEDSDVGIVAAQRAGMVPLLVPDLKAPSDEAVAAAFQVLRSLDEARTVVAALAAGSDPQATARPKQRLSTTAGLTCVGALIRNTEGRIFVQRRSSTRRILPGTWDIVGGHVESGETPQEALAREINEETGWTLRRIIAKVADWRWTHGGIARHERDYLVEVEGDLDVPRLEQGKHDAYAWIGPENLALLMEGRDDQDSRLRDIVASILDMTRSR
jgi:beta-phosphoglucomutase-like phosphatase (HAD superfamily)/ADP-ribose pyrophosphatase YjhB (NUDIX family)